MSVVAATEDEGQRGVEGGPVDAPVVPLEHVLHHRIPAAEELGGGPAAGPPQPASPSPQLVLETRVVVQEGGAQTGGHVLAAKSCQGKPANE